MKKLFFLLAFFLFATPAMAQFDSPNQTITAINTSQDNADAFSVGAHPGDIVRIEYSITSDFDVFDFVPSINLSGFEGATITDAGLASFDNGNLVFPLVENAVGPFEQSHSVFVRVNEQCGGASSLGFADEAGVSYTIPLTNCDQVGGEGSCHGPNGCGKETTPPASLPKTGPGATVISLIIGLLGLFFVGFLLGRRV